MSANGAADDDDDDDPIEIGRSGGCFAFAAAEGDAASVSAAVADADNGDVFDVYEEMTKRTEQSVKRARSHQQRKCHELVATACAVTPWVMERSHAQALDRLLELQRGVRQQCRALAQTTLPEQRVAAAKQFGTSRLYNVVLVDPPWHHRDRGHSGSTKHHYKTMKTADICKLPISGLMYPDACVLLWTTGPHLDDAMDVLSCWGCEYSTVMLTWIKVTGYQQQPIYGAGGAYTAPNAEFLLIGIRGNIRIKLRNNFSIGSVIMAPRRDHSRKPDAARRAIARVVGELPRISIFEREEEVGWDTYGAQNNLFAARTDTGARLPVVAPVRSGRSRANNVSGTLDPALLASNGRKNVDISRRDRGPQSSLVYYSAPSPGVVMTKTEYAWIGSGKRRRRRQLTARRDHIDDLSQCGNASEDDDDGNECDDLDGVVDIRQFDTRREKRVLEERHPTYLSMSRSQALAQRSTIRRIQDHNAEVLYALNNNAHDSKRVRYTDDVFKSLPATAAQLLDMRTDVNNYGLFAPEVDDDGECLPELVAFAGDDE